MLTHFLHSLGFFAVEKVFSFSSWERKDFFFFFKCILRHLLRNITIFQPLLWTIAGMHLQHLLIIRNCPFHRMNRFILLSFCSSYEAALLVSRSYSLEFECFLSFSVARFMLSSSLTGLRHDNLWRTVMPETCCSSKSSHAPWC